MSTPIKCLKYTPTFFTDDEFRRAKPSCSLSDMNCQFMRFLDQARSYAGVAFVINSAFRTVEHEKSRGRSGTSSHCKGIAVDIRCLTPSDRIAIVSGLVKAGFRRIGIHSCFIHADMDSNLHELNLFPDDIKFTPKPDALWLYSDDFYPADDY